MPVKGREKSIVPNSSTSPTKMCHYFSACFVALVSLTASGIVGGSPVQLRAQKGSFDLPLAWNKFGFLGNLSLGTPAQPITSFVDWTWISQYVFTEKSCHGEESRLRECLADEQHVFNLSQSSTFRNETASYPSRTWNPNHFFFYEDLSVKYISEVETVGPSSAPLTIQAADVATIDLTESPFPFAGVYGLSPVFEGDDSRFPFYKLPG